MIKARNTYSVDVDRSSIPESYTIALFIWQGDKNTPPLTAEYSITKQNLERLSSVDSVGISDIVRDFIEPIIPIISNGVNNFNATVWVKYQVFLDASVTPSQEETLLFIDGYNVEDSNILLDGFELTMYDNFLIPVKAGETYTVLSFPDGNINSTYVAPLSDESSEQVSTIKITRPFSDTYISVSDGVQTVYIYPEQTTRLGVSNLVYFNSHGVLQLMPFFGEKKDSFKINREDFRTGSSPSGHTYTQFNTNARGSIKLKSGYHTEGSNKAFESLFLSEYVWLGDDYTPVNIDSSSFEYKTRVNDKVISYDISLKESFDKINTL